MNGCEICLATREEICQVLEDLRTAIDQGLFFPVDRSVNLKTLASLGLTWLDVKSELYDLDPYDYWAGPEIDRDYPQTDKLWIFKKDVLGKLIYIKFKIEYQADSGVKVISFHIDTPHSPTFYSS